MPHPFRTAVETKDVDAMAETLAEDVVFHSPVLFKPFLGREAAMQALRFVGELLPDLEYTDEIQTASSLALRFKASVGDREVEGIDFLELNEDGGIARLTVFMRPLSALNAFNEAMGAKLQEAGVATP